MAGQIESLILQCDVGDLSANEGMSRLRELGVSDRLDSLGWSRLTSVELIVRRLGALGRHLDHG